MTEARGHHVYLRRIEEGERTSLSVLAGLVAAGSRVLDLGTGSGALGAWLADKGGCVVDGVTLSEDEAALARAHYRRVEVADLEEARWAAHFAGERYDAIICADVLEHLRRPEETLALAKSLLAPGGRLLISVPNAAYAGLVAELMHGEFRYRDEGLLDRTHLRFFTRRSLVDFLVANGWDVDALEVVARPLSESEFRQPFDDLPPSVARYLVTLPDAGSYQFIATARPGTGSAAPGLLDDPGAAATAQFSAQLYADTGAGFTEDGKQVVAGRIGALRQVLAFPLPAGPVQRLRFDPADRPGFLHLHAMRLVDAGGLRWSWRADEDGFAALERSPHADLLLRSAWPGDTALVLLHGDDPWLEVPVPAGVLAQLQGDARLEVELGWPMSADYAVLAESVPALRRRVAELEGERARHEAAARHAGEEIARLRQAEAEVRGSLAHSYAVRDSLSDQLTERLRHVTLVEVELERTRGALAEAQDALRREEARLVGELETLRAEARSEYARFEASVADLTQSLARESAQREADVRAREERLQATESELAAVRQRHGDALLETRRATQQRHATQQQLDELQGRFDQLAQHLRWIEGSTVFRATRPLVRAKMALDRWLGRSKSAPAPAPVVAAAPVAPVADTVDVIVPVYRGLEDTQRCIESVLAAGCRTPWRLVVLNDASPEPEVTQWLREVAQRDARITLLENPENLGFVGTVNRGMALSDTNDVVLVNSDAEVANDWLDRLRRAAYADRRVASVTPFSNNATICSYPRFCEANELPPGWDTPALDRAFAEANAGQVLDVPTGVGFCMYIRRDCLREIGLFDVEQFGKGYGEENDFCRRAADAGWRNLHALDTFVRHAGGVSFGASKSQREIEAIEKLRRLHPTYDGIVHAYVAADPPREARLRADVARVRASGRPGVLLVLHDRAGGTLRHAYELAAHLGADAEFFSLVPAAGGAVRLQWLEPASGLHLEFALPSQHAQLLQALRTLGISHVHYHHLLGHQPVVRELARDLGVAFDFTAHDYHTMCPHISLTDAGDRFCGESGRGECGRCSLPPDATVTDVAGWRAQHGAFLAQARHVLVPSRDAARRIVRMWPPLASVRLAPHTDVEDDAALPAPQVQPLAANSPLRIAVLGGLSRIKGADVLEEVAMLAARADAPLEFHLVGHAYRHLAGEPQARLVVHGQYREGELETLIESVRPDVVWFPALWPETYSYTLSACLHLGLPVVVSDLGAFAERLAGRPWSWVARWDQSPRDWLDLFVRIREEHFLPAESPEPPAEPPVLAEDARIQGWSYGAYLEGVRTREPEGDVQAVLAATAVSPRHEEQGERRLRELTLQTLARLRATPALRPIARAVPQQWQTRVKTWLRA